jgi:transposase-like protein
VVLKVYLLKARNGLVAASFMRKLMIKYSQKVVFITDGGRWCPWAVQSLGARWVWLKGGVRATWSDGSAPSRTALGCSTAFSPEAAKDSKAP